MVSSAPDAAFAPFRFTPMIAVGDIAGAVAFFTEGMGFTCFWQDPGYAFLMLGPAAIRLVAAPEGADMEDERRQASAYLDLKDIDAYYAARLPHLEGRPGVTLRAPFDQDYGQREWHVIFENLLVFVGEPIDGPMQ